MGRGQKQANRTKNNTKPSSSSRCAEILGTNVPTFVGFSANQDGGYVTVLPGFSTNETSPETDVDPVVQMLFRKMCKKDSITKLKALNEYTTFVNFSEETTVLRTLAIWPRLYCQLSADVSHRVREATQIAHGTLVNKCGRNIAPYLKQMVPVWIVSQYDTYAAAKSQAKESFDIVFPANKKSEVLAFCRNEILSFVVDNLIVHSSLSLSNAKLYTPEERDSVYERMTISNLQAYEFFINNIPDAHLEWLCENQEKIVGNSKFWALGGNKIPMIRSSCYGVIGSLAKRVCKWFESKYGEKACKLLFGKLCENDSEVVVSVLENSILLMAYVPEWWKYTDVDGKVMPCISSVLSSGGWNNATRVAPLMVPLLVHLLNVPDSSSSLFDEFIEAVCRGLEQRCVILSKTAYDAWLNGLTECLEYIADTRFGAETDIRMQNLTTLSKAIRSWLTSIIRPKISNTCFDYVKLNVVYISRVSYSWTKLSLAGEKKCAFSQLIRIFWQNLQFLMTTQLADITAESEDTRKITDVHLEFLSGLKTANSARPKKNFRVKFDLDDEKLQSDEITTDETEVDSDCPVYKNYRHALNKTVQEICIQYFTHAMKKKISSPILNPLYSLIEEFDSKNLHQAILKAATSKDQPLRQLYDDFYALWLKDDCMRSQVVVDLTFALMNHLDDEEQTSILSSFNYYPLSASKWFISRCLTRPYLHNSNVKKWLVSDNVHTVLLGFCKFIINEGDKNYLNLLKTCFTQTDNGEMLISEQSCSEIILIFTNSLDVFGSEHINLCASFASSLVAIENVTDCDNNLYMNLLIGLFKLECNQKNIKHITSETVSEVNSAWRGAISTLSIENLTKFLDEASRVIHARLVERYEIADRLKTVESVVTMSHDLIRSALKTNPEINRDFFEIFSSLLLNKFDDINRFIDDVELYGLSAELVQGRYTCFIPDEDAPANQLIEKCLANERNVLDENELLQAASWILYCVMLMERLSQNDGAADENDIGAINEDGLGAELKRTWTEILYGVAVFRQLYTEYRMMMWYDNLSKIYNLIESTVVDTIKKLSPDNYTCLLDELKLNPWNNVLLWSHCVKFYENINDQSKEIDLLERDLTVTVLNFIDNNNFDELLGFEFCSKLQILKNQTPNKKDHMISSTLISLSHLYKNLFVDNKERPFTSDDAKKIVESPVKLLAITEEFLSLKKLILIESQLTSGNWNDLMSNISMLDYLTTCVDQYGWELQFFEWDFITITLVSLLQLVAENMDKWDTLKVSTLNCAVLKLYCSMTKFISNIRPESERRQPTETLFQLLNEWKDLVSPAVHSYIIEIFMRMCVEGMKPETKISSSHLFFINSLHEAMQVYEWTYIEKEGTQHSLHNVLKACLDIMASPCHHIMKYIANSVLKSMTPTLINSDKITSNKPETPEENINQEIDRTYSVHAFEPVLSLLQGCMETVLSPYKIGEDHCILIPYSDSHSIALGYLLIWEILLDIAQESTAYLQHEYSEFFKEGQFVDQLLSVLFRLLPDELVNLSTSSIASNYFKNPPLFSYNTPITWELISSLACHRLLRCLQGGWLSALVRGWWGSLPTRSSQYVELIVRIHVSPLLIAEQLSMVAKKQNKIPNIEISIHTSVNEVQCIYLIEDLKMGLSIQMCSNHPLNKPVVISSGTPLSNMTWLSMYLAHQNGSVYQAIRMWANAVQKKVESTPVCYVCYCRLHPATAQMPKMLCQTCRNKFHSACLYKWFSTSGKATCPMCRNVFSI